MVPFGLDPAVLTGTWALVLDARGATRWVWTGFVASVIGAALVGFSILLLVWFGSAAQHMSDLMVILVLLWMVAAPVVAAAFPLPEKRGVRHGAMQFVAAVLFPIALIAAFFATEILLPPGS